MSAPWLIVCASLLFSTMALCVKLASAHYTSSEIVFYRSLTGALTMYGLAHWQGGTLRTSMPSAHFWRSLSGVISLMLWFYAITNLPLATAMTLNYMSAVWMALFLLGGALMLGGSRVDSRLIITVLMGFAGVGLILRPTIEQDQLWHGLVGLLSGMIAATAYLQVTALGRAGEPEYRIVFYFSVGGVVLGGLSMLWTGASAHTLGGIGLLLAVGLMATAAQLMMTRAYRIGRPLVNASLQYLGIAFSYVYGVVLFADRITWMALTGMALIVVAGIAASMLRSQAAPADAKSTLTET
jgi:drug/metabolite transporter (DMT)-like permease